MQWNNVKYTLIAELGLIIIVILFILIKKLIVKIKERIEKKNKK